MNNNLENPAFIEGLRNAAPYIHAHRDQCFVIALSGASIAHANFENIVYDIGVLHSLGIRVVLVYGFRHQIEHALQQSGITSQYHHQLRITDKKTLDLIEQIAGQLRIKIEAAFSKRVANSPLNNSKLHLFSGNLVTAAPMGIIQGVDMQHTGKVRNIDTATITRNLAQGQVALISTLAYANTAEIFNLALSELAQKIAQSIKADKLIVFSKDDGLFNSKQQLIRQINSKQLPPVDIQETQSERYNMLIECVNSGIKRAHVLSYQQNGALLQELFTHVGSGTLISQEDYEQLRDATLADIDHIIGLIEPFEEQGVLIKRPRDLLEREISHFTLIECDQCVVACAALYPYMTDTGKSAEIACIVTHPEYQKKGLATSLLGIMQDKAKQLGCTTVFVLSTQTVHWFIEHGFREIDIEDLPQGKKDFYNYSRNARVLSKELG